MDLTLRNLRYFVAAAQLGSFTAAAEKLSISQPSISAAVTQLEELLQVQLFLRFPSRGIELTQDGRIVLEEALRLLAHVEEFGSAVGAVSTSLRGELSIGCFINLAPVHLAEILTGFENTHPNIHVNFREAHHGQLLDRLKTGQIELALTFDLELPLDVSAIEIATRPVPAVLSANHPLGRSKRISLRDLADEPLILMDLPHTNAYFLSLFHSLGLVPRVGFRTRSFEMVRCLAGAGMGYGLTNLTPSPHMTYDGSPIKLIPLSDQVRPLKIVLMHHSKVRLRKVALAFVEYVTLYFRSLKKMRVKLRSIHDG